MKKLLTILLSLLVFTSAYAESFFVKSFVSYKFVGHIMC